MGVHRISTSRWNLLLPALTASVECFEFVISSLDATDMTGLVEMRDE